MAQGNDEQVAYWNEQAGAKWVELQERMDQQLGPLGAVAIDRLAPAAGERIVDVGCGCGASALALAERVGPAGRVLGVDVSAPMLARARERARQAGLENVSFVQADAAAERLAPGEADAVFSRFGIMFFSDPAAAFANLRAGVRPGGRLGFVCWQGLAANEWARIPIEVAAAHVPLPAPPAPGAPGPFQLADPDRVRAILIEAGWCDVTVDPHEETLGVGGTDDLDEAVDFLLRIGPLARVLADVEEPRLRATIADAMRERLARLHGSGGVRLGSAIWLVGARAPA